MRAFCSIRGPIGGARQNVATGNVSPMLESVKNTLNLIASLDRLSFILYRKAIDTFVGIVRCLMMHSQCLWDEEAQPPTEGQQSEFESPQDHLVRQSK